MLFFISTKRVEIKIFCPNIVLLIIFMIVSILNVNWKSQCIFVPNLGIKLNLLVLFLANSKHIIEILSLGAQHTFNASLQPKMRQDFTL